MGFACKRLSAELTKLNVDIEDWYSVGETVEYRTNNQEIVGSHLPALFLTSRTAPRLVQVRWCSG